jgi:hypothetical protein
MEKKYHYSCLPNGLASSPRLFTKLMKPVFATLRQYGYKNDGFIVDSLLIGDTEDESESNIKDTNTVLKKPKILLIFLCN